ncbi:MAG: hypothetical protein KBT04_00590 [Bacteroidales bacterium]|nr:hypothetical protein [Candidatus Colimorpha onthohippi]
MALKKSIEGDTRFFKWLMEAGYPELGAFSNAIRGDVEALHWLFNNRYEWLGIIVNAIDGIENAYQWLTKAGLTADMMFALACRKDSKAIKWLEDHDLILYLMMADEVYKVNEQLSAEMGGPYVWH